MPQRSCYFPSTETVESLTVDRRRTQAPALKTPLQHLFLQSEQKQKGDQVEKREILLVLFHFLLSPLLHRLRYDALFHI